MVFEHSARKLMSGYKLYTQINLSHLDYTRELYLCTVNSQHEDFKEQQEP